MKDYICNSRSRGKGIFVIVLILISTNVFSQPFITTWQTDNSGPSDDDQITIPTFSGETYNYNVDWGDGNSDTGVTGDITHTYAMPGTYVVSITGQFPRIYFDGGGFFSSNTDHDKILSVNQWGDNSWTSMEAAFSGCSNLRINASDTPDLTGVTDMSQMFFEASAFNDDIGSWNVTTVTNMFELFRDAENFNQPLDSWNVENVLSMEGMFRQAEAFNQPLNSWDVRNVTTMREMFFIASSFNGNISNWQVENVQNMTGMFGSSAFNQDISGWTVDNVTIMSSMFNGAEQFNQDISGWNMGSVTNISFMFSDASAFNADISGWNIAMVNDMEGLFRRANSFNADITGWDVSGVSDMARMFQGNVTFNQDISGWLVNGVSNMEDMFNGAILFNQDISSWVVDNVGDMSGMFSGAEQFNQDISGWNVGNVDDMRSMFSGATSFDQNLGGWDVTALRFAIDMFNNSGLSIENYDNILIGWNSQTVRSNVSFGASGIFYCSAEVARAELIANNGWFISDGGQGCIAVFDGGDPTAIQIQNGQSAPIDFGSINLLPSSRTRNITILNQIATPVTSLDVSITGTAFTVVPAAPTVIAPGNFETINVVLSGSAPGSFTETLTITSASFSTPFVFTLIGEITVGPEPEIAVYEGATVTGTEIIDDQTSTYDFGSEPRGASITREIAITNKGSTSLDITSMSISGSAYSFAAATPTSIAVGAVEVVQIILDGSTPGFFQETLTIINNDTDEGTFNFDLEGEILGPDIVIWQAASVFGGPEIFNGQTASIDFGSGAQGIDITRQITIGNFNPVDLAVSSILVSGSAFSTSSVNPFVVAAEVDGVISGVTVDIVLSGANPGAFNETVVIASDDPDESSFSFPISGQISAVAGTIKYVKWDATGNNDGTSWTDAFTDLQNALAASDSQDAIWIATGVYTPDLSDPGNTSLTFNIPSDELRIYGGFNGTESLLSERIGDPSLTILSGDLNGDDGPDFTNTSDNSENVLTVNGLIAYIDDLTISGGNSPTNGGGILANNADIYITDLILENNQSNLFGGGIYLDGGSIELQTTVIRNNEAGSSGGGAYVINAEPYLFRTTFESNEATNGAGLYMENTNQVNNTIFYYNQFINNGRDPNSQAVVGGAIYLSDSYYESFGSLFINNYAYDAGGAIYTDFNTQSTIYLTNSTFGNNASNDTSADIYFTSLDVLRIYNSIFWGGTSVGRSGSLASINDFPAAFEIRNSIVQEWDPSEYSIAPVATNVSDADPLFTDPTSGNFTITNSSTAIDMGNNSFASYLDVEDEDGDTDFSELAPFDLAGNPRFFNSVIDIGAYENQFVAVAPEIAVFSSSGIEVLDGTGLIDLGSQVQGSGINETISINNTGTSSLEISTIIIPAPFILNSALSFPISVSSGGSQLVDIFLPGSTVGTFTETIIVNSNDSDEAMFDFQITATITAANTAPTLSTIPDVTFDEDGSSNDIPFTIGDSETSANDLIISVTSDNLALVPLTGIVIGGSGASRTITITPEPNLSGTAIITVSVDDGTTITSQSFTVTVLAINDAPVITGQDDLSTPINTPILLNLEDFQVEDVDNAFPDGFSLQVNTGTNYSFDGNTVTPVEDFTGELLVPITVNDGESESPIFNTIIEVIAGEIAVEIGGEALANGDNINFDDIPVGAEDSRELFITNSGTSTLVITDILIDGNDFRLNSPIPDPIAPGNRAAVSIIFQPTSVGAKTATLTLRSESANDFQIILSASGLSDIPPLEIFNVVTTQQNDKHDFLEIRNIEFYDSNRVFIYSRWGNEVYKTNDYNNQSNRFIGNSDDGDELPDGTYYYVIELNGGETVENGFFLLRR